MKVLYRYDYYIDFDVWTNSNTFELKLYEFPVLKKTPKGYWINASRTNGDIKKKFVMPHGTKAYARTTKEKALICYIARKKSQIIHLEANIGNVRMGLVEGERLMKGLDNGD